MSMGLPSTKFSSGQPVQRLGVSSRQFKVAPSIAEQAIFIPKPHDRVDFKLKVDTGGASAEPMPTLGQGKAAQAVQLMGSGDNSGQSTGQPTGQNIATGQLGAHGLTARFNQSAWQGQPGGYVEMEINNTPNKQTGLSDPIPTQEEGRQVNNRQIHFTQQYDSYGRPRIGFSREPYDFAATKYVSVTNQIAFQANMAQMHDEYDKYLLTGNGAAEKAQAPQQADPSAAGQAKTTGNAVDGAASGAKTAEPSQPDVSGQGKDGKGASEIPIFGSTSDKQGIKETGANARSDKVTAKESFEMQKTKSTEASETSENDGDSDDTAKSGAVGHVGVAYGKGSGQDAKSGSLNVAV
ncbi:MAG: hypothetical protein HQK85_12975 [Nitrospinae bacterium]|nr:hypothetical protein [Nitrospinota bacterium]